METTKRGRGWFTRLATRVSNLGQVKNDDSMTIEEFNSYFDRVSSRHQKSHTDRSQGPNYEIMNAMGFKQTARWYPDHHMIVQHNLKDRKIAYIQMFGMGGKSYNYVYVSEDAYGAWHKSGAGYGFGVNPVEIDCRHLNIDEIMLLTEATEISAPFSVTRWNCRCTAKQIAEIAERLRNEEKYNNPNLSFEEGLSVKKTIKKDIPLNLQTKTKRIIKLFDRI